MRATHSIKHQFVEAIPRSVEHGTLYISITYDTTVHRCFCGCGSEVVTPLSPTDWKLTYDGATVSLYPSIGNWALACQSHYWIKGGRILWAEHWSQEETRAGRLNDIRRKTVLFEEAQSLSNLSSIKHDAPSSFWSRIAKTLTRIFCEKERRK